MGISDVRCQRVNFMLAVLFLISWATSLFIGKHSFSVKHIFKLAVTKFQYVFCIQSSLFPALISKFIWFTKFKDLVRSLNVSGVMHMYV